ncbi:MAG: D-sedoheptulose 7-phosphate isomerase [Anaerolineae bacterium]|nr:D-sedoheptulose 7-phosphate isomerase [Anaerolineae bacterium]
MSKAQDGESRPLTEVRAEPAASPDHRAARAREHLLQGIDVRRAAADACLPDILAAADLIGAAFRAGNKLLLCGNGGSAADCQHMAAEFTSRLTMDYARPGLPALALTTDTSFLTAFSNDIGFEDVFMRQVQALGREGDVLLGISTSGGSKNVVRAVEQARRMGMRTIALIGGGGKLRDLADVCISVPSAVTQHIQETHLAIEHIVCHLVERDLYGYER